MPDALHVLLLGASIGVLSRSSRGALTFTYDPGYASGSGPALSPDLQLGDRAFKGEAVQAYLEGLLPDDPAVRQRWASRFEVPDTPFDLLGHMGLDCPGAVQFLPEGETGDAAEPPEREVTYVHVTDEGIAARIRQLRADGSSWALPDEHWSLPGAQEKFSLARRRGRWYEPHGSAPATHIIKPGIARMRHQAEVEFATMRAARRLGLSVADVELLRPDGEIAVAVRRFDRPQNARGDVERWHQVDLCQAIGVLPSRKYEARGGPSARTLAGLLRRVSTAPETDVRRFSDALLFNYLSGSPDGHAKNFSLLLVGTQVRLAPLYDLATGLPYDARDAARQSAFAIGGVRNFGESYPKHWRAHARDLGLDEDERVERVRHLARELPEAFRGALLDDVGGDVGPRLWARLEKRLVPACRRVESRWRSHDVT